MAKKHDRVAGMPLDLLLVRHGQSEGNVALEAAKHDEHKWMTDDYLARSTADYRLTRTGREQAARAGTWVRGWIKEEGVDGFDALYCSPFVRTRETAALLDLPGAEWRLEPLLRERDFGLWEGKAKRETNALYTEAARHRELNKFLWRPECGESTPDIDLRSREMFATLAREQAERRVLCVTHEDVMWAMRFRLEKMTVDEWLQAAENKGKNEITNCAILHYTRVNAAGVVQPRFDRWRLIDTAQPDDAPWERITRRRFSNSELQEQVSAIQPLWDGAFA